MSRLAERFVPGSRTENVHDAVSDESQCRARDVFRFPLAKCPERIRMEMAHDACDADRILARMVIGSERGGQHCWHAENCRAQREPRVAVEVNAGAAPIEGEAFGRLGGGVRIR